MTISKQNVDSRNDAADVDQQLRARPGAEVAADEVAQAEREKAL
jgi:hypothetical protein